MAGNASPTTRRSTACIRAGAGMAPLLAALPRAGRAGTARALLRHFGDRRRERQLFSTGAFFATFAAVRAITHAIRAERGPFRNITPGGLHIHHMTFGITGLLTVGYLWMLEIGVSEERRSSRVTAAVYGAGAALTLDEFALWLNLADDYWTKQGRESIDAVALFGSLLVFSALGKGFFTDLLHPGRDAAAPRGSSASSH